MVINRESMESYNLGALADIIIANQTGLAPLALAELERRKTVFQQNAAEAQKRAAAAQETEQLSNCNHATIML